MTAERAKTAVIVVDVQGDFTQLANGPLAVNGTEQEFMDAVRAGTEMLRAAGFAIFATQDWHPPGHLSFFTNHRGKKAFDVITIQGRQQVLWPPHCVQGTEGARLLLDEKLFDAIVKKGMETEFDSYSGFQDDGGHKTLLDEFLQGNAVSRVVIYGIATDYCVKATALDAVDLGYQVIVIKNLIRGVAPDSSKNALEEMGRKGVLLLEEIDLERIAS